MSPQRFQQRLHAVRVVCSTLMESHRRCVRIVGMKFTVTLGPTRVPDARRTRLPGEVHGKRGRSVGNCKARSETANHDASPPTDPRGHAQEKSAISDRVEPSQVKTFSENTPSLPD